MKTFALAVELGRLTPQELDRAEAIAQSILPAIINATKRERGGTAALAEPDVLADRAWGYALGIIRETRAYRAGRAGAAEPADTLARDRAAAEKIGFPLDDDSPSPARGRAA